MTGEARPPRVGASARRRAARWFAATLFAAGALTLVTAALFRLAETTAACLAEALPSVEPAQPGGVGAVDRGFEAETAPSITPPVAVSVATAPPPIEPPRIAPRTREDPGPGYVPAARVVTANGGSAAPPPPAPVLPPDPRTDERFVLGR